MKTLTYIQLRAARQSLNLGVRDVAKLLKVSKATISKAELGKTRDFFFKHSAPLIDFFYQKNIIFPNEYAIRLVLDDVPQLLNDNLIISLTRFQLKSARNVLNLSQQNLADNIGVDKGIISRAELLDNSQNINTSNHEVIINIRKYLLKQGIEFPDPYSIFFKKYIDSSLNY